MCVSMHVWLYISCVAVGTLTCSKVARVSVCPQALLALKEKTWAFGQETRRSLLKEDSHKVECWQEPSKEHQVSALLCNAKCGFSFNVLTVHTRSFKKKKKTNSVIISCLVSTTRKTWHRQETETLAYRNSSCLLCFFLFHHTERCRRCKARMLLQRNCTRHGGLFESTSHTVWLLFYEVRCMSSDSPFFYLSSLSLVLIKCRRVFRPFEMFSLLCFRLLLQSNLGIDLILFLELCVEKRF